MDVRLKYDFCYENIQYPIIPNKTMSSSARIINVHFRYFNILARLSWVPSWYCCMTFNPAAERILKSSSHPNTGKVSGIKSKGDITYRMANTSHIHDFMGCFLFSVITGLFSIV